MAKKNANSVSASAELSTAVATEEDAAGREEATDAATLAQASGMTILEVDPDHILIDPELRDMREWSGSSKQELGLAELARSIHEEGQQQPGVVRETPEGMVLIMGHRRHAAVKILKDQWAEAGGAESGDPEPVFKVVVDESVKSDHAAYRLALIENVQRENFTDIELARQIKSIRKRFGWNGANGTKNVADFLTVSPATVTQKEKLLDLPTNIQGDVQAGRMTATAALELAGVRTDKQAEVHQRAQERADEEDVEKQVKKAVKKQKLERQPTGEMKRQTAEIKRQIQEQKKAAAEKAKAEGKGDGEGKAAVAVKHVRAAVKAVEGARPEGARPKVPRIAEAIELFEQWGPNAYPRVMADFSEKFVSWAHGKLTDKQLTAAWDDVADKVKPGAAGGAGAARGKQVAKVSAKAKVAAKAVTKKKTAAKPVAAKPVAKNSKPKTKKK